MKRPSYLTPSRRLPKAPLPFNLPSLRREAGGDGAGGGIAGAGAKWASPRAEVTEDTREEDKRDERSAAAKTAWGGAGLRAMRTQPDFPELARPVPTPLGTSPRKSKASEDTRSQKSVEKKADRPKQPQDKTQTAVSAVTKTPASEEDDWAEDDANMDFIAEVSLPEVTIPDVPPPPIATVPKSHSPVLGPPRVLQNPNMQRRSNVPAPAAHWAHAIKLQQMDRSIEPRMRSNSRSREIDRFHAPAGGTAGIDLKLLEEQKNIMKTKAEIAQETRRKEDAERERVQKERAAKKLMELEERLKIRDQRRRTGEAMSSQYSTSSAPSKSKAQVRNLSPVSPESSHKPSPLARNSKNSLGTTAQDHDASHPVVLMRPRTDNGLVGARMKTDDSIIQFADSGAWHGSRGRNWEPAPTITRSEKGQASLMSAYKPDPDVMASASTSTPPTSLSNMSPLTPILPPLTSASSSTLLQIHTRRDESRPVGQSSSNGTSMSRGANVQRGSGDVSVNFSDRGTESSYRRNRGSRYSSNEQRGSEHGFQGRRRRPYMRPTEYEGPTENETREQWLNRRRMAAETREAVRSVIEHIINCAAFGARRKSGLLSSRRATSSNQSTRSRRDYPRRDFADDVNKKANTSSVASTRLNPDKRESSSHQTITNSARITGGRFVQTENKAEDRSKNGMSVQDKEAEKSPNVSRNHLLPLKHIPAIGLPHEIPRQAPQRRLAPLPLRPAPWAPKAIDSKQRLHHISPVTAQIRAEGEEQGSNTAKTTNRSSQHAGASNGPTLTWDQPQSVQQTTSFPYNDAQLHNKPLKRDSNAIPKGSLEQLSEKQNALQNKSSGPQAGSHLTSTKHCQDLPVTIPPSLGGNVKVLMKPSTRRDPGKEGQGYITVQNESKADAASDNSRVFNLDSYRGRGNFRRGRAGRSDHVRRGRREYPTASNGFVRSSQESVRGISNVRSTESERQNSKSRLFNLDEGEESKAWAKSSTPSPPTSFDEITRAFSNQPATFPLVGAPLLPSVPVVPVVPVRKGSAQSSSTPYSNSSSAWSSNKNWSAPEKSSHGLPPQRWKNSAKAASSLTPTQGGDHGLEEIVRATEKSDRLTGEANREAANFSPHAPASESNKPEKADGKLRSKSRRISRVNRKPKRVSAAGSERSQGLNSEAKLSTANISSEDKTPANISSEDKTPANISSEDKIPANISSEDKTPANISAEDKTLVKSSEQDVKPPDESQVQSRQVSSNKEQAALTHLISGHTYKQMLSPSSKLEPLTPQLSNSDSLSQQEIEKDSAKKSPSQSLSVSSDAKGVRNPEENESGLMAAKVDQNLSETREGPKRHRKPSLKNWRNNRGGYSGRELHSRQEVEMEGGQSSVTTSATGQQVSPGRSNRSTSDSKDGNQNVHIEESRGDGLTHISVTGGGSDTGSKTNKPPKKNATGKTVPAVETVLPDTETNVETTPQSDLTESSQKPSSESYITSNSEGEPGVVNPVATKPTVTDSTSPSTNEDVTQSSSADKSEVEHKQNSVSAFGNASGRGRGFRRGRGGHRSRGRGRGRGRGVRPRGRGFGSGNRNGSDGEGAIVSVVEVDTPSAGMGVS